MGYEKADLFNKAALQIFCGLLKQKPDKSVAEISDEAWKTALTFLRQRHETLRKLPEEITKDIFYYC